MFSTLSDRLHKILDKISGKGVLKGNDIEEVAREIRMVLLSADVHYKVTKDFVDGVSRAALGSEVLSSLNASQVFTKIVYDEITGVLGGEPVEFDFSAPSPLIVLLAGLQGSGKTTTAAKFARWCMRRKRFPILVPADVKRPAAIEQLKVLAGANSINCFDTKPNQSAVGAVRDAIAHAKEKGYDTVIIDTAGRLHVDEEMMSELKEIVEISKPHRVLYVADAMTGQDALNAAKAFDGAIPITGLIFTKLDGDSKGGAILSVKHVTGKPIYFSGVGEKVDEFESFDPRRIADRILGMGDVVGLVERVEMAVEQDEAKRVEERLKKGEFGLDDFLSQLGMVNRLGGIGGLLKLIPGARRLDPSALEGRDLDKELKRKRAIISSMTRRERKTPSILNGSRRKRIALGSGTTPMDVNSLLREYDMVSKMVKSFSKGGLRNLFKGLT